MIECFERETCELNDKEKELVPSMILGLRLKTTKESAVSSKEMIQGYRRWGYKMSGARIRKLIHYIQVNKLLPGLVSCGSKGYYCTEDRTERLRYVASLLARSNSIKEVAMSVMESNGFSMDDIHEYNFEMLGNNDTY